jgi:hypothetical protein
MAAKLIINIKEGGIENNGKKRRPTEKEKENRQSKALPSQKATVYNSVGSGVRLIAHCYIFYRGL